MTTKNIPKWRRVIKPSIRSKFDQNDFIGATPKRSARPMITKKLKIAYNIREGVDWNETYRNYEKHIKNISKRINEYIKDMQFENNISVGLVQK